MSLNLGGSNIGPGAANPETAANTRMGRLDAAMTETLTVDLASGNATLTEDELQQCVFLQLNNAAVARDCNLVAVKRILFVRNSGTAAVTLVCGTAEIEIAAASTGIVRLTGNANGLFSISSGGGDSGASVPDGGTTGQVLKKASNTDGDVEWAADEVGEFGTPVPDGGTTGQLLAKNSNSNGDVEWVNDSVPAGGTTGQALVKVSNTDRDVGWSTVSGGSTVTAIPCKPPTLALFPHTRNGTGVTQTQTESSRALTVSRTDGGASSAYRYAFKGKNVPAGSSWDVIAGFKYNKFYISNSICIGLGVRLNSTDRMLSVRYEDVNGSLRYRTAWHIGDNYQTALTGLQPRYDPEFFWTKINWNGTDYKFYISGNFGETWLLVDTRTASSYITADQVGIFIENYNTITTPDLTEVTCIYYKDPDYL